MVRQVEPEVMVVMVLTTEELVRLLVRLLRQRLQMWLFVWECNWLLSVM
jgi:hypothetical protein